MLKRIFALACACLAIACRSEGDKDYELDEHGFDIGYLRMLEEKTGIVLPDSTRGLHLIYFGSRIDPSFAAKLAIAPSQHESLLRQIEGFRDRAGKAIGAPSEQAAWWLPDAGTVRIIRQFDRKGDYVRAILCEENGKWFLYLEWMKI